MRHLTSLFSLVFAHLLPSLVRLDDAGYVKDILISPDDTGEDIRTKILIAFSDIEPLVKYGFRLLFVHRKMKLDRHGNMVPKHGVPCILRTGKRELDFPAIKRYVSPYRPLSVALRSVLVLVLCPIPVSARQARVSRESFSLRSIRRALIFPCAGLLMKTEMILIMTCPQTSCPNHPSPALKPRYVAPPYCVWFNLTHDTH